MHTETKQIIHMQCMDKQKSGKKTSSKKLIEVEKNTSYHAGLLSLGYEII